jgi:DNA-binding NarL/FixJ family response regulator
VTQRDTAPVRVVVADRQPLFRRGVVEVIAGEPDLVVVGETDDGAQVLALVDRVRADVVLLDLTIPGGGVEACALLRDARPDVRVVVLAHADDDAELGGAVRAGARGYLLKDTTPLEMVDAVRAVAAGNSLLSPAMAARVLDEFAVLVRRHEGPAEGTGALSRRELEVLTLVAQGLNNRSIAEELFISENTVKNHVRNIHEKLQVHSRMEAVVRAVRDGVLQIA